MAAHAPDPSSDPPPLDPLAVYHDRDAVSVMEASLIREFSCDVRCKNRAPGGENAENMGGPPFFTYLAIGERGPQQ